MPLHYLDPRQAGTEAAPDVETRRDPNNDGRWILPTALLPELRVIFPDEQSALRAAREAAGFGHVAETACDDFRPHDIYDCAACADGDRHAPDEDECDGCAWPRDAHRVQS